MIEETKPDAEKELKREAVVTAIADAEGDLADMADSSSPTGYSTGDRLSWQRERDMLVR